MNFGLQHVFLFLFFYSTIQSHFLTWLTNFAPNLSVDSACSSPFSNTGISKCEPLTAFNLQTSPQLKGLHRTRHCPEHCNGSGTLMLTHLFSCPQTKTRHWPLHTGTGPKQQPIPRYLYIRLKASLNIVSPSRVHLPLWYSQHLIGLCCGNTQYTQTLLCLPQPALPSAADLPAAGASVNLGTLLF